MRFHILTIIITSLLILSSCKKDAEIQPKEYPYVITNTPTVNSNGAEFSANLTSLGNQEIIKYGFVWSTESNPSIQDYYKLFDDKADKGIYTCNLNSGFAEGQTYYVRAYILTDQYEVYGNEKSFVSQGSLPPTIDDFEPKFGPIGTEVIITGKNFALSKTDNLVKFGDTEVIVDSVSENQLFITIPKILKPEKVKITIETAGMEVASSDLFDLWFPWRNLGSYSIDLYCAAAFNLSGNGYIIQRNTTNLIEYSPIANSFTYHSSLPESSSSYPLAAQSDTKIVVVLNKNVYELQKGSFTWRLVSCCPIARTEQDYLFCLNDDIYIGSYSNNSFFKWNPDSSQWIAIESTGIKGPFWYTYSSSNSKAITLLAPSFTSTRSLYEFDSNDDTWEIHSNIPAYLDLSWSHFHVEDKVFVGLGYGGGWGNGYASNQIWCYDTISKKWTEYQNCPQPIKETTLSMTIGNKGYVFTFIGTYSNVLKEVWEFDPSMN